MSNIQRQGLVLAIACGIAASLCYWLSTGASLPFRWSYLLFFGFGPFLIAAVYGIYTFLRHEADTISLQLATLLLISAGLAFTFMATTQGMIRGQYREQVAGLEDGPERDALRNTMRSVDSTQQGLDMAFDIFISTGTALLGISLARRRWFGWWFTVPAIVIGAGGLFLNAASFPTVNASDAGYFDPGPFYGVFFAVVLAQLIHIGLREFRPGLTEALSGE